MTGRREEGEFCTLLGLETDSGRGAEGPARERLRPHPRATRRGSCQGPRTLPWFTPCVSSEKQLPSLLATGGGGGHSRESTTHCPQPTDRGAGQLGRGRAPRAGTDDRPWSAPSLSRAPRALGSCRTNLDTVPRAPCGHTEAEGPNTVHVPRPAPPLSLSGGHSARPIPLPGQWREDGRKGQGDTRREPQTLSPCSGNKGPGPGGRPVVEGCRPGTWCPLGSHSNAELRVQAEEAR